MRLYNIKGRLVSKKVNKYLINWDKPCRSQVQFDVKQFLKNYWVNQVVYEEFPVYGTRLKVDLLNATRRIAIEVQGRQHSSFNPFFHSNSRLKYLESIKRDFIKREWLEKNNFIVVEIEEHEVKGLNSSFFLKNYNLSL